jgi:hypothetical protein
MESTTPFKINFKTVDELYHQIKATITSNHAKPLQDFSEIPDGVYLVIVRDGMIIFHQQEINNED